MSEKNEKKLTADEAAEILAKDKEARMEACRADIDAALALHRCQLDAAITISSQGAQPSIRIVPL